MSSNPIDEGGAAPSYMPASSAFVRATARLAQVLVLIGVVLACVELVLTVAGIGQWSALALALPLTLALCLIKAWFIRQIGRSPHLLVAWVGGGYIAAAGIVLGGVVATNLLNLQPRFVGLSLIATIVCVLIAELAVFIRARIPAIDPVE
ncbi:MAG: hypothetical protein Q4C87_05355 [Actinomycetaceae bacterium]|nr:hypothetical protein [Actinomycetaceae bacterium]